MMFRNRVFVKRYIKNQNIEKVLFIILVFSFYVFVSFRRHLFLHLWFEAFD